MNIVPANMKAMSTTKSMNIAYRVYLTVCRELHVRDALGVVAHDLNLLVRFDIPLHYVPIVVSSDDLLVEGAPHERCHLRQSYLIMESLQIELTSSRYLRSLRGNRDGHDRLVGMEGPRVDDVDDAGVAHLLVCAKRHHLAGIRKGTSPHGRLGVDATLHLAFMRRAKFLVNLN